MAVPIVSLTVNLGADNHTVDTYKGMVSLRVLTDRVMEEFGNVREMLRKKAHVVTVNDYLAQRDAEWMSTLYNFPEPLEVGMQFEGVPEADEEDVEHAAVDSRFKVKN